MSGYVKLYRSIFDSDAFQGEPFSRREAWIWLVANAAWKPHEHRYKSTMVPIGRGQLPGARKALAKAWGWGEQRVRTYLELLQKLSMISLVSNQQLTIISICNYDKYQQDEIASNQQLTSNQPATNHTEERKEKKERKKYIYPETEASLFDADNSDAAVSVSDSAVRDEVLEAFEAYNATAAECGLPKATKLSAARRAKIKSRLDDYGLDGWKQALANIEKSSFLTGGTSHKFMADLDFLCQPKSFDKCHDGGYGNGRHRKNEERPGMVRMLNRHTGEWFWQPAPTTCGAEAGQ